MIDIENLEEKFSIEGVLGFAQLEGDLVYATVSNKFGDADICLYGAHVTSFTPQKNSDILWMSTESSFEEGSPIRGGIPVCFPWFGPHPSNTEKPQHGFARLMYWDVIETATQENGETLIKLQLCASEETKAYWDYDFCAEVTFIVGSTLRMTLKVSNASKEAFDYGCALHSYFSLSGIENISIEGLQTTKYHNQITSGEGIQESEKLEIKEAITRHYYDTVTPCVINDPVFGRRIRVDKLGSKITTVWNPGKETCVQIADIADDAYHAFVCLETVNAYNDIIHLGPGESHETTTIIGLDE